MEKFRGEKRRINHEFSNYLYYYWNGMYIKTSVQLHFKGIGMTNWMITQAKDSIAIIKSQNKMGHKGKGLPWGSGKVG